MKEDILIEKIKEDCPICNKIHLVEKRKRINFLQLGVVEV